jgi:arsenate reductase (thioredoxin)
VPAYVLVQIAGAVIGVWTAHVMFGEPILEASLQERSGPAQMFSEFVATFGLLAVICGCSRRRPSAVPFAVAAYIGAAFWFTASTSFANPAVTVARAFTDSVAGIRPADVPGFIVSQLAGALTATVLFSWVVPRVPETRPARPLRTVLFACVHNAGRSQMAAAWFNLIADPEKARAISAGTDPGTHVHPEVVEAMREAGVDLSRAATTRLTPDVAQQAQLLVTMGCGDQCPVVPGARRDDWPLDDPKGKPIAQVRAIRDDIRDRVWTLVEREGWLRS